MHVSIVGTGYVGLVTGACFAQFGLSVTCMDSDERRIGLLEKGRVPFYEPGLAEIVARGLNNGLLRFSTDLERAVADALVIFIAVGTPSTETGSADLSHVEAVSRAIGRAMNGYKVIATKSTVPIGSGRLIYDTIKRNQQQPTRFDVVANPEFLREGSAVEDFLRPNRIIIGAESDEAVAIMKDLYRPLYLLETPFVVTNMESAEIIKYASNAFLATKVSFINEVAMLCERVGADVQVVAKGMGLDGRIGNKFLHAGPGYGGSCFPKDVRALIATGQQHGCRMAIAEAAAAANDRQQQWVMDKIRAALGSCSGQRIGMLGLSFKPNTSDIRESPALHIARLLLQDGAAVQAFDPAAQEDACRAVPELLACRDAYHAAAGADALILATEWNEFRNLDLGQVKSAMRGCTFIDLRNVYVPTAMGAAGFHYISVGRPACRPSVSV